MTQLTLQKLQSHLWESANILRGSIDSSDYKNYIFGMMFLKRLSDVFDEETETAVRELIADGYDENEAREIAEDPDEHRFYVPEKAHWNYISSRSSNIGEYIAKAFHKLEDHPNNTALAGVLTPIDFNDKERLPDVTLRQLIEHFDQVQLGNKNLPDRDTLGDAYMYLIRQFADDAGKKGGEFYTPQGVVQLLVELLKPQEGMTICDPTTGSGGMLLECVRYVRRNGGNPMNLRLFGQEKNLNTWAIAKINMLLHDRLDARIEKGDTIRDPKLTRDSELMLFDRVLANPPFSLSRWGKPEAKADGEKWQRFEFGVPSKSYGDLAFVQHMLATLKLDGMCGVVMPHGVLFRGGAEERIRKGIIEKDWLEAVVGLPENLFYGTGIPACLLIFNKAKTRRGEVLFIHAAEDYGQGTNQNILRDEDIARIVATYDRWEDEERYASVVPVEEIEENDYNLNIPRYVDTVEPEEPVDMEAAIARYQQARQRRQAAEAKLADHLKRLGFTMGDMDA